MRINHNISALNAWRQITQTNYAMSKTLEKLSSGLRINRAGDDAAGLAISEKMRGQIRGINMAIKNAQDAISLIQTAEGALNEVHSILQRMRELAVQAASDTNTDVDRAQIQKELDQLREEIDRISRTTEFNTKKLLDGKIESFRNSVDAIVVTGGNLGATVSLTGSTASEGTFVVEVGQFDDDAEIEVRLIYSAEGGLSIVANTTIGSNSISYGNVKIKWDSTEVDYGIADASEIPEDEVIDSAVVRVENVNTSNNQLVFQIGANEGHNMVVGIDKMSSAALGLTTESLKVTDQNSAERTIMILDGAIHRVSTARAALGAVQNRLEHTIANLGVAAENLTAAESRIRDADMAREMMKFTKQQILMQSATAMLAQANAIPQSVLRLMRS